jgi:hypothetical protein
MSASALVAASVILLAGATAAAGSSLRESRSLPAKKAPLASPRRIAFSDINATGAADLSVRGPPMAVVSAQHAERPGRALSWVLATGGAAVLGVSGIGLAVAAKTASDYENQQATGAATITRDRIDCAKRLNRVSWAGLIVGGAAATWGIIRLLQSPSVPAVSAAVIPGGAALAMAGQF